MDSFWAAFSAAFYAGNRVNPSPSSTPLLKDLLYDSEWVEGFILYINPSIRVNPSQSFTPQNYFCGDLLLQIACQGSCLEVLATVCKT